MQTIVRKGNFDSGHRVMNERFKCYNCHGHTYLFELHYSFLNMEEIGYAIDFKEIKRVGCAWIDDMLDHGMILNPEDIKLIQVTKELGSKMWIMSLNGEGMYCNPTVENVAKEVFLAQEILFGTDRESTGLRIDKVVLYETPNCWTECTVDSISHPERRNFRHVRADEIFKYAQGKGIINYDDRKA